MANLTQTAASVIPSSAAQYFWGTAGAAIAAGQPIFEDTADLDANSRGKMKLADADASSPSAITAGVRGLAGCSAAAGQPVSCVTSDPAFTHGLTGVVKGDIVILSATAGALAPVADLASGMRPSICLVCTSATQGVLSIVNGPVAK